MLPFIGIGQRLIIFLELRITLNGQVWLVSPHGKKDGFVDHALASASALLPQRLTPRNNRLLADRLTIATQNYRILVARCSIVLRCQPQS